MECKIQSSDLILYADGSLPAERRDHLESHLEECFDCREFLSFLKKSLMLIESDKEIVQNPFLYTRIMEKLGSRETHKWRISKKVIPAFAFSFVLLAAIFGGIYLGRLWFGNNPLYSNYLQEEISYIDDIKIESIETFFLISNDEDYE